MTTKELNKKVVLTTALFTARQEAGTLQEGVEYEISDYQEPVQDVKISGTSILSDGVANIPHASVSESGVIKTGASFNTNVLSSGYMQAVSNTYVQYQSKGNDAFIGKGTLENVLDNESVRVDKATSLTDTQKAQARTNISAWAAVEYTGSETSYADNTFFYVVED